MKAPKVLYVCEKCWDSYPESCGRMTSDEIVIMPDGAFLCEGCFDFRSEYGYARELRWSDLPHPAPYNKEAAA